MQRCFHHATATLCAATLALILAPRLVIGQEAASAGAKSATVDHGAEFAKKLAKAMEAKTLLEEARLRISVEEAIEQMEAVREVENTKYFDFCMERVTKEVTEALAKFPNLTSLNLRCDLIDADAAPALTKLKKLTGLHVTGQVTDEFAEAISSLPYLQQLSLNPEKLSARGCKAIATTPMLGVFYVTGSLKGGQFFSALGERARAVTLWKCKLDEEATKSLSKVKHLHSLTVDEYSAIDGDLIAAIAGTTTLKNLRIRQGNTSLTAAQLKSLAHMTQLVELDLAYTFLSEPQLLEFANAEKLLNIEFRGEVSKAAIETFLKTHPKGCQVIQLTTESIELEGWKYALKNGLLAFDKWPEEIRALRGQNDE